MKFKKYFKKAFQKAKLIISYAHPFTSYRQSEHTGTLHIVTRDGKKILESDNANYSFNSLHRIMRFVFNEVEIQEGDDILLLWLWWGSVLKIVRKELKKENKIVAVDIDPVIIEIAQKEFNLDEYTNTEIVCQDAYDFVISEKRTYGLIIVDLWIDNKVPDKFFEAKFWHYILQILSLKWQVVFNMLMATTDKNELLKVIQILEEHNFTVNTYDKVDRTNWVIIGKK